MPLMPEESARSLLWRLQTGVPLTKAPFAALASELHCSEVSILAQLAHWQSDGTIRRFGAVFDSRRLGYTSTLCATEVHGDDHARLIEYLRAHPGVTHAYERSDISDRSPLLTANVWFTLTAPQSTFQNSLDQLRSATAPLTIIELPAQERFKLQVLFRTEATQSVPDPSMETAAPPAGVLSATEQDIVRRLQTSLPLTSTPFTAIASSCGLHTEDLLRTLRAWTAHGTLRRIAAIVQHRRIGYTANGMALWPCNTNSIIRHGRALASHPAVTHCYARAPHPSVPFPLYAMMHAESRTELFILYRKCQQECGLQNGHLLLSTHEWKKTSPVFFGPEASPEKTNL